MKAYRVRMNSVHSATSLSKKGLYTKIFKGGLKTGCNVFRVDNNAKI